MLVPSLPYLISFSPLLNTSRVSKKPQATSLNNPSLLMEPCKNLQTPVRSAFKYCAVTHRVYKKKWSKMLLKDCFGDLKSLMYLQSMCQFLLTKLGLTS